MNLRKFKGYELINYIGEENCKFLGDKNLIFTKINSITNSSDYGLTFCSKKDEKAISLLERTRASIILCHKDILEYNIKLKNKLLIAVDNPRLWFIRCLKNFFPSADKKGIHPTALIGENCKIGNDLYIGAYVTIGDNVQIGTGSKIYAGVHIYDDTIIGSHVVINSGSVVGADGFGYERNENQVLEKFPHIGCVIIENFVEIGANTCIDRGTIDPTFIGQGTKIDNLVHIGHNARIGKHCVITAHCMVGRSAIGDYSWLAPCSCIRPGQNLGKRAFVGMGAIVTKDIPDDTIVAGSPAREISEFRRYLQYIENKIGTKGLH